MPQKSRAPSLKQGQNRPKQAKTGQNRPKQAFSGVKKGPLGPPPTAEGAKNEVFGKKSKFPRGNPLRKVPNADAVPLVGAHEERYPFALRNVDKSLFLHYARS